MWLKQRINTIFPTDYELEIMGSGICEALESVLFPTPPPHPSAFAKTAGLRAGIYFNVIMCDLMHSSLLGESSEIIRRTFHSRMQNASEVN